jgi:hypothetical protein
VVAPSGRPVLAQGGLTLAEAFHLLARALGELPIPATGETLRARMAVLHGKEDSLLETGRFAKLLRQANDAEVADVRMVGEDQYEVSPHKADLALQKKVRATAAAAAEPVNGEASPTTPAPRPPAALRFRGGSRSATRPPEIPMFGVVELTPTEAPAVVAAVAASDGASPPAMPAAADEAPKGKGGRGRAAKPKTTAAAPATGEEPKAAKKAAAKGKKPSAKSSKPRGG